MNPYKPTTLKMSGTDPLGLEYAFAQLFEAKKGDRGHPWDTGTWDSGSYRKIGALFIKTAGQLDYRLDRLTFTDDQAGLYKRAQHAVERLRAIGDKFSAEPENVHNAHNIDWVVITPLIEMITVLFELLEKDRL